MPSMPSRARHTFQSLTVLLCLVPQVVSAPLPRVIKERAERTAGYKLTKEEVSKWQPIVKVRARARMCVLL